MAFDNVSFPDLTLIHGVTKDIIDPVSVVGNGVVEYRNQRTRWERFNWTLPTQAMREEKRLEIRQFLLARDHSLNSFKFTDPDIPELVDAPLQYHSGSGNSYWYLSLPIDDSTPSTRHPLFSVTSGLTAKVNGSSETISSYTTSGGVPVIQVANSDNGDTVTISGDITFVVRLDSTLSWTLAALDTDNRSVGIINNQIILKEVFES